jgi:hypothetical protein
MDFIHKCDKSKLKKEIQEEKFDSKPDKETEKEIEKNPEITIERETENTELIENENIDEEQLKKIKPEGEFKLYVRKYKKNKFLKNIIYL